MGSLFANFGDGECSLMGFNWMEPASTILPTCSKNSNHLVKLFLYDNSQAVILTKLEKLIVIFFISHLMNTDVNLSDVLKRYTKQLHKIVTKVGLENSEE